MSKKRDIDQLIGQAVLQGFRFTYQPSGHWKAENPTDGRMTRISSTPRSNRGVKDARARLKRIGFKPTVPQKPKVKEEKQMALKVVETKKPSEVENMPKLGEIAELRAVMGADDVRKDFPMAAYTLWNAVHVRIKASSDPDRVKKSLGGVPGRVWAGSRKHLMEDLWPGLSRADSSRLGSYLSGSRNMAALVRGRGGMESVWWVSDEFNDATMYQAKKTPLEWWREENEVTNTGKPRVTDSDLTVKVDKGRKTSSPPKKNRLGIQADEQGYYRCTKCTFATKHASSFYPHIGKLDGKVHPVDDGSPFKCRYCDDLLPTHEAVHHHQRRNHKTTGETYCRECKDYYSEPPRKHRTLHTAEDALETLHENVAETSDTDSGPSLVDAVFGEEETEQSTYVVTPRSAVETGSVVDAEAALRKILSELGSLRVTNDHLVGENNRLANENNDLRAEIHLIKEKMAENEKFVDGIRNLLK